MVNKRRATADSDSEDQLSQPTKRARTNDDDSEDEVVRPKREKGKGKGKAARRDDDESDEDMQQPTAGDNEEEEKQFEEMHGEAIRAALDAKRKVQGVSQYHSCSLTALDEKLTGRRRVRDHRARRND